ncbi:MAG TPA: acyltransferase family protein [Candidatus Limnocylindrales bacterium]
MAHPIGEQRGFRSQASPASAAEASRADRFRPDLEGLRAVAVILVLLYHARVPGFGGGYVGVDVFFVLSGYLITGLIVRELRETGSLSLEAFYARRARRLLPAAALVLLVTLVATAILTPSFFAQSVAADGLAAALYASNVRFALQATDYLAAAELDPSPLLHYWSLGVEEQFYLLWPTLLLLVARRTRSIGGALTATSAFVFFASFGLSIVLTEVAAPWAFFSLPARAWELALGALIALQSTRLARLPQHIASGAVMAGLALVAASALVIEPSTPFPGSAAILPVGGGALVILAGIRQPASLPSRLLAIRPARYIGRISYSLYLWHWPFIILPTVATGLTLSAPTRIGLVFLAVVAAAASQRWVEEPIRHGRWVGLRPARSLAAAGALTLVVATVATAFGGTGSRADSWLDGDMDGAGAVDVETELEAALGPPATHPAGATPSPNIGRPVVYPPLESRPLPLNLLPPLDLAPDSLGRIFDDGCFANSSATESPECAYGDPDGETTVVLFGDSHAAHWFPPLETIAGNHGWRLVIMTKANCPAADIRVHWEDLKRRYQECDTWREWALERIAAEGADLVIVSNSRAVQMTLDGIVAPTMERPDEWEAALGRILGRIRDTDAAIALIGDTPRPATNPVKCLWRHRDNISACGTPVASAIAARRLDSERSVANAIGATFIDPTPWICPTDPCPAVIGRLLIYRDAAHMTAIFAAALTGRLERELVPILSRAAAQPG